MAPTCQDTVDLFPFTILNATQWSYEFNLIHFYMVILSML